jgi:Domain of unknown function (DUF4265)
MDGEWIWVEPSQNGTFKVLNIPLYAYGVSYLDEVSLTKNGSIYKFDKVANKSGNHNYRILLRNGVERAKFENRWPAFASQGCEYESSKDPEDVFGINVPPQSDVNAVYALLEDGQNDRVWYFDEGNFSRQAS